MWAERTGTGTSEGRDKATGGVASATQDFIGGVILVAIAMVSFSQMGSTLADWIFPRILTYIVVIVGGILIVRSGVWFGVHRREGRVDVVGSLRQRVVRDVVLFIVGVVIYVLLQPVIGFWIASVVMLTGMPFYLSVERTAKELVPEFVIALLVCAVAYVIFAMFFLVPLPSGSLFGG